MNKETIYRALFVLAFIAMTVIRLYYQSRVLRDRRETRIRENSLSLMFGGIAALTAIVFGVEYIFFPGSFSFAYALRYPDWIRWLGAFVLAGGVALLGVAHHYLGESFHSLVVSKEDQLLVETGPYRWIRHPIYTAYLMSYVGGGLVSGNWVLTVVPGTAYAIMIAMRMGEEEKVMEEQFGQRYIEYKRRTGRLLPPIKREP